MSLIARCTNFKSESVKDLLIVMTTFKITSGTSIYKLDVYNLMKKKMLIFRDKF